MVGSKVNRRTSEWTGLRRLFATAARIGLLTALALVLSGGALAVGCGGDDDADAPAVGEPAEQGEHEGGESPGPNGDAEAEVEQTVRDYIRAAAVGDADAGCPLVTDEFMEQAWGTGTDDDAPTCEEVFELVAEFSDGEGFEIGGEDVPLAELDSVPFEVELSEDGTRATVRVADEPGELELERRSEGWRLTGFADQ